MAEAIVIRATTVAEMQALAGRLMADHWAEATDGKQGLDIDWVRYQVLEDAGLLVVLSAWDLEEIVGYVVTVAVNRIHAKSAGALTIEAIYVVGEYRKSGLAMRLLHETEAEARERWGEAQVVISAPVGGQLDRLMRGLKNYHHRETVYMREV